MRPAADSTDAKSPVTLHDGTIPPYEGFEQNRELQTISTALSGQVPSDFVKTSDYSEFERVLWSRTREFPKCTVVDTEWTRMEPCSYADFYQSAYRRNYTNGLSNEDQLGNLTSHHCFRKRVPEEISYIWKSFNRIC